MSEDSDVFEFSGTCRLFPLPGVVLLPHVVISLHIFEPRYRQMMEDALRTDKFVTIVQLQPAPQSGGDSGAEPSLSPGWEVSSDEPPLEEVGCVGKIIKYERLPDGRFNLLLQGRYRVRLHREIETDRLYRMADAEVLHDISDPEASEPRKAVLIQLFRTLFFEDREESAELIAHLESSVVTLGELTDLIAHALNLPPAVKQVFLADCHVLRRADLLIRILGEIITPKKRKTAPFPPPFSLN